MLKLVLVIAFTKISFLSLDFQSSDNITLERQTNKPTVSSKGDRKKLHWKEKQKINRDEQQKKEDEATKVGMSSAISTDNIGFKMLQQMGYRPGSALGKCRRGAVEPVQVDIKRSRTGLGRDAVMKEQQLRKDKALAMAAQMAKAQQEKMMTEFEDRKKQSWQSRRICADYRKAFAALAQLRGVDSVPNKLDVKEKQEENREEAGKEAEEEEDEVSAEELNEVLCRLRTEFNYCLYCGCQYESGDVLLSSCPGIEDECH